MNCKKILLMFRELSADPKSPIGIGLLDSMTFIMIGESDGCSKADLYEKIYYSRSASKSGLDGPVKRLIGAGFVEAKNNPDFVSTKTGDGKILYYLTDDGRKLFSARYRYRL